MALEKDRKWYLDNCSIQEITGIPVKWPSPAKYKKDGLDKNDRDQPEIRPGMLCVVRTMSDGSVKGYMKCIILAWEVDNYFSWDISTRFILQIIETSHHELEDLKGTLITCKLQRKYYSGRFNGKDIVSFDISNYKWV